MKVSKLKLIRYDLGRYYKALSFFIKRKFSRQFKRDQDSIIRLMSMCRRLAKYCGQQEGNPEDERFVYRMRDPKGYFFELTYSDKYGCYPIPNAQMELFKEEEDGERILISQFSPTLDMFLPKPNKFFGDMPFSAAADLDIHYVLPALVQHYHSNILEIAKKMNQSPSFILERLVKNFPYIEALPSLKWFMGSFLTSEDLTSLEERLKEIDSSEKFTGAKIHKGRKLVRELTDKYYAAMYEKERKRGEEHRKKEEEERVRQREQELEDIIQEAMTNVKPTESPGQGIMGYRRDIRFCARSTWEANFARVLMHQGIPFLYEPRAFELTVPDDMKTLFDGKEKVSYIPDFQIEDTNKFIEVKGDWFNYNGEECMAKTILFRRQNPNLELKIIGIPEYNNLEKEFKNKIDNSPDLCGWETSGRTKGHNLFTSPQDFE